MKIKFLRENMWVPGALLARGAISVGKPHAGVSGQLHSTLAEEWELKDKQFIGAVVKMVFIHKAHWNGLGTILKMEQIKV